MGSQQFPTVPPPTVALTADQENPEAAKNGLYLGVRPHRNLDGNIVPANQ
jgi:hypothetical protein